ncbi:hypothetical protein [Methylococcus geothermalis]|uniref:hypothetical protein n=1 Tax=Methylococcus geothermalis TaxID=2681310 RepID=UPI0038995EE8
MTLTLGVGSLPAIALLGMTRGRYSFSSHLKWCPVILLGNLAAIGIPFLVNSRYFRQRVPQGRASVTASAPFPRASGKALAAAMFSWIFNGLMLYCRASPHAYPQILWTVFGCGNGPTSVIRT